MTVQVRRLRRPGSIFDIQEEMNRMLQRAMGDIDDSQDFGSWNPAVDVYQTDDKLSIVAELPGLKSEAFLRRITLPRHSDLSGFSASMKDGVLLVEVPKAEQAKPKKIAMKAEEKV